MNAKNSPERARTISGISTLTFLAPLLAVCTAPSAWAALEPAQILILVNKDSPISSKVGRMYQKMREIPAPNLLRLSLGTERQISPEQYWSKAAPPINLKTAVDSQRCRQDRDLYGFSTAAQFTQWVTTAIAANTCG
jgi:hypothetical protein